MIVKINELSISEYTTISFEKGFAYLAVEFIPEQDTYSTLETSQTIKSKGIDVTKKHDDNIASAFKQCFDELQKVGFTNIHGLEKISKPVLLERYRPKL